MFSKSFLACLSCTLLLCLGCGDSFQLQSIVIAPQNPNLAGIGTTQQFTVTANYTNLHSQSVPNTYPTTSTKDVTKMATYSLVAPSGQVLAPASALTLSSTGQVTVVNAACTWTATTNGTTTTYTSTPYILTATFENMQAVSLVDVKAATGCQGSAAATTPVIHIVPEQYRKFFP